MDNYGFEYPNGVIFVFISFVCVYFIFDILLFDYMGSMERETLAAIGFCRVKCGYYD